MNYSDGIKITSFDLEREYQDDHFSVVNIQSGSDYKALIVYLKAGQFIPIHSPSVDMFFAVFKGTGTGVFGMHEEKLFPGKIIFVPRDQKRGIRAETDMEAIHFVSPPPNSTDHDEVEEKLGTGSFR